MQFYVFPMWFQSKIHDNFRHTKRISLTWPRFWSNFTPATPDKQTQYFTALFYSRTLKMCFYCLANYKTSLLSEACCGLCSIAMGQGCDIDVTGQTIYVSYSTDGGHNEHGVVGYLLWCWKYEISLTFSWQKDHENKWRFTSLSF